jgi:ribosomal protein S27AE
MNEHSGNRRNQRIKPERPCGSCGATSRWLTVTPCFGDHPSYQVFECTSCGYTEWISAFEDRYQPDSTQT